MQAARPAPRRPSPSGSGVPTRFAGPVSRNPPGATAAAAEAASASSDVGGQRRAHFRRQLRARAVLGMIDADADARAGTQALAHLARQLEAQEMHGGGLLVVLALEVLVGDGGDALRALHLHPD